MLVYIVTAVTPSGESAMADSKCAGALYRMPMPETMNETIAKTNLQQVLRRQRHDESVIEVRTLSRCGVSQQSIVELEVLKSPTSDG